MKVKLKPGKGTIANAVFELVPGQVANIDKSMYDPEVMDIIEADPEPVRNDLDINQDGKVDKEDAKLASKVLNSNKKDKDKKKKGGR